MAATLIFFSLPSLSSSSSSPRLPLLHRNPIPVSPPSLISLSRNPHAALSPLCAVPPPPCAVAAAAELAAPPASGGDDLLDISKLGISEQIVSALSRRGITELFPIQRAVLEPAMEGRDMIGRAITGSGKTLAFGIPILDKIIRHRPPQQRKKVPSALVLAPTRELARQVQQEFKISAPSLSSTCIYGGMSISNQVRTLGYGMDIVVGTPGRIIDLVERGALDLSEVRFVVLDEADQMLAIGFQEAVECILSYLPARKQCMLFSATMPSWVNSLSRKYLKNPLVVDLVGDSEPKIADGISLYSVASSNSNKQNLLPTLISTYAQGGKSIIFTKTKKDAEALSRTMRSVIGSKALHGDMQQSQRDRTLAAFRSGQFHVLVATDVAARGLDIPNVDLVIHFEMPNSSEFFVHRSGRTGRAGNKGTAILLFTESQRRTVRQMERELGVKFEELRGISGHVATGAEEQENFYESSDELDNQYGNYGSRHSNYTNDRQYGNYGRSRGSNNISNHSEGSFRGKNYSSRSPEPRRGRSSYAQTRTQWPKHGDYDSDDDRSSSSSRFGSQTRSSRFGRANGQPSYAQTRTQWPKRGGYASDDDRSSSSSRFRSQTRSSRFGSQDRSSGSSRMYGDRSNQQQMRTKNRSSNQSRSSDYDFDSLLDLFKDS